MKNPQPGDRRSPTGAAGSGSGHVPPATVLIRGRFGRSRPCPASSYACWSCLGRWRAHALVPGVEIHGTTTLFVATLLLSVVNAFVRPLLVLLTLAGSRPSSRGVEVVLEGHPAVAEAAVVGIPHPRWGRGVAAWVVCKPAASASRTSSTSARQASCGAAPSAWRFL
ncbi:MAG: phage holin family protein [Candidatus Binatia bacterium]